MQLAAYATLDNNGIKTNAESETNDNDTMFCFFSIIVVWFVILDRKGWVL